MSIIKNVTKLNSHQVKIKKQFNLYLIRKDMGPVPNAVGKQVCKKEQKSK